MPTLFRLVEVGVLNSSKPENYETGQLFLHKVFGYRGVVLFPWTANVFDKEDQTKDSNSPIAEAHDRTSIDEIEKYERQKAKKQTFYQVLIDNRDIPYIVSLLNPMNLASMVAELEITLTLHSDLSRSR